MSQDGAVTLWDTLIIYMAAAVFGAALGACKIARSPATGYFIVVPIGLALAVLSAVIYWRLRKRFVGKIASDADKRRALGVFVALPLLWLPAWMFIAFNVARLTLRLLMK